MNDQAFDLTLLECATQAATLAARHAYEHRLDDIEVVQRASHDLKLQLDRDCEQVAYDVVAARFPGHGFFGEERGKTRPDADYQWIVDPIDGSVNYFRGLPYWCTSVAVQHHGRTRAAAVCAPAVDELFTARADGVATCNGRLLHVDDTPELQDASLHLSLGSRDGWDALAAAVPRFQKLRVMGSIALDLCHVASGAADVFFAASAGEWDYTGALLIAERAGAAAVIDTSREKHRVLCTGHERIDEVVELLMDPTNGRRG